MSDEDPDLIELVKTLTNDELGYVNSCPELSDRVFTILVKKGLVITEEDEGGLNYEITPAGYKALSDLRKAKRRWPLGIFSAFRGGNR